MGYYCAPMVNAAVLREFGSPLSIEQIKVAPPGPSDVQVAVKACAICHSDIMFFDGAWGGATPAVYGHEAAGVVEAVGEAVDSVAVGDHVVISLIRSCGSCHQCERGLHVACTGDLEIDHRQPIASADGSAMHHGLGTATFADTAVVDASQVVKIPADMAWPSASLLGCGVITGYGAVANTAAVEPGSHVVVIGCGGVGLNSLQAASIAGAASVIAVDLDADKRADAVEFGATHSVDPTNSDAAAQVSAITEGRGADYVFVTVGAKAAIEQSFSFLAPGGAVVIVGMTANGITIDFDSTSLAAANQRVLGSKMGSGRLGVDIAAIVELYQQGRYKLDELVSRTYRLDQINEAVDDVKTGGARRNVVVFDEGVGSPS